MNDFSELEKQLRELKPAQPSADLVARIERALGEEESTHIRQMPVQGQCGSHLGSTAEQASTAGVLPGQPRFHFNWLSLGLGLAAAAALVIFAFIRLERPAKRTPNFAAITPAPAFSSPNPNGQLVPAGLTQVVYHTNDEGLHFTGNSAQPMRRVRSQTRDTLQWRNPKTGATLRISYPREDVSLIPVSGQ
jgi:hypothetical protein